MHNYERLSNLLKNKPNHPHPFAFFAFAVAQTEMKFSPKRKSEETIQRSIKPKTWLRSSFFGVLLPTIYWPPKPNVVVIRMGVKRSETQHAHWCVLHLTVLPFFHPTVVVTASMVVCCTFFDTGCHHHGVTLGRVLSRQSYCRSPPPSLSSCAVPVRWANLSKKLSASKYRAAAVARVDVEFPSAL